MGVRCIFDVKVRQRLTTACCCHRVLPTLGGATSAVFCSAYVSLFGVSGIAHPRCVLWDPRLYILGFPDCQNPRRLSFLAWGFTKLLINEFDENCLFVLLMYIRECFFTQGHAPSSHAIRRDYSFFGVLFDGYP